MGQLPSLNIFNNNNNYNNKVYDNVKILKDLRLACGLAFASGRKAAIAGLFMASFTVACTTDADTFLDEKMTSKSTTRLPCFIDVTTTATHPIFLQMESNKVASISDALFLNAIEFTLAYSFLYSCFSFSLVTYQYEMKQYL